MIKQLSLLLFLYLGCLFSGNAQEKKKIRGLVTDGSAPLEAVNIKVEGSNRSTTTNSKGVYSLQVNPREIVRFTYQGMGTERVFIESHTEVVNVVMEPQFTFLDGVTVTGRNEPKKSLEEEYATNKNMVRSSVGYLDQKSAGGTMRVLDVGDLATGTGCFLDLLRSRFPGVEFSGDCFSGATVYIRGGGSISSRASAVFDVDGQVFTQAPIWLSSDQISRIAVISSLDIASRYGILGNGGVIVINTKTGSPVGLSFKDQRSKGYNTAYYDGNALDEDRVKQNDAEYLKELRKAASYEEALLVYQDFKKVYADYPYFQIDAYRFFRENFPDQDKADSILSDARAQFAENIPALKALAYQLEYFGEHRSAVALYKDILKRQPRYPQSYLDLSNSLVKAGDRSSAATYLYRLNDLLNKGFIARDSVYMQPILEKDQYQMARSNPEFRLGPEAMRKAQERYGLHLSDKRLKVSWNDSEARFRLDFVNPNGQVFTWEHPATEDSEQILNEQLAGINSYDFFLDELLGGKWQIITTYLGNRRQSPVYLKFTLTDEFGAQNPGEPIIWVKKLHLRNVSEHAADIKI